MFASTCLFTLFVTQLWLLNPCVATKKELHQVFFVWMSAPQSFTRWNVKLPFLFICGYTPPITQLETCKKNFSCMNPVAMESDSKKAIEGKRNHNVCPNKSSHIRCGHCTSFVAMFRLLHSITNEQQCKKILCNKSRLLRKM